VSVLRVMEKTMTCAEFQETLPELFEAHADLNAHEHLKTCENCAALVRDLEYIAETARMLLEPEGEGPSSDLWGKIEREITSKDSIQ